MNRTDLNDIEGLKFMPVTKQKRPIIKNWQHSDDIHDLSNCEGIGLVCGALSGGLEVIDVDAKYSLDGKLYQNYKKLIHAADNTLLSKLLVQTTKGGGYHMIYRCSEIAGNLKLANRPSTETEREFTYQEAYKGALADPKNKSDEEARAKAKKAKDNDKVRVLIETRGEGGYVMCFPSVGYELVNLDFYGINEITKEQRDILHDCARQLNEVFEEVIVPKTTVQRKTKGLSCFDDYNERGDIIQLLQDNGWKLVSNRGNKTHFLRPGQTTSQTSGNFDHNLNRFSVFTTSTEFEPNRGYMRYAVFAFLECNKDFSAASKRLYDMGFGERDEQPKEKSPSTRVIPSRVDPNDSDLSFIANGNDYDSYLQQAKDGTLPMGLSTGSLALDEYFLFKKGNLVMFNGHDNVGKSVFAWWLMMITSLYYGWKWIVFSSENSLGAFMRKMIEFYCGKEITRQSVNEYNIAKLFVEANFKLIRHEENLFNYKDIMNMVRKARKALPDYQNGLIDPYNSLKTDLSGFSKLSTHEYHYEAMSELQADCQANKFTWFVNHHVITEAGRRVDSEGYQVAPNKADTEGGAKIANKAHEFVTVHRKSNHPQDWMIIEVHVRKVKETETGGRQTPLDNPVKFRMINNKSAFEEVREDGMPAINPIARWRQTQEAIKNNQPEHKHWLDRDDYVSFEQFKEHQKLTPVVSISSIPKDYTPDDEERQALNELLRKEKPF